MRNFFRKIGTGIRRFWHLLLASLGIGIGALALHAQSASNSATWSWTAPTTFVDGTSIPSADAITYSLYVGTAGKGSEATTAVQTGVSADTVTTSGYAAGAVVCGEVTSVVNGVESGRSNEACKTFPDVPNPPTNNAVK